MKGPGEVGPGVAGQGPVLRPSTMAPTPGELVQLDCPICMSLLTDPFVTPCGHTFCYGCISTHLQAGKNCPSCQRYLTKDLIYPNFLLSKITQRAHEASQDGASAFEQIQRAVRDSQHELQAAQIDSLLALLGERKRVLEQSEKDHSMGLLLHFLQRSREGKRARLGELHAELACLEADIRQIEGVAATGPASAAEPSGVEERQGAEKESSHTSTAAAGHAEPDAHSQRQAEQDSTSGAAPVVSAAPAAAPQQPAPQQQQQQQQQQPPGAGWPGPVFGGYGWPAHWPLHMGAGLAPGLGMQPWFPLPHQATASQQPQPQPLAPQVHQEATPGSSRPAQVEGEGEQAVAQVGERAGSSVGAASMAPASASAPAAAISRDAAPTQVPAAAAGPAGEGRAEGAGEAAAQGPGAAEQQQEQQQQHPQLQHAAREAALPPESQPMPVMAAAAAVAPGTIHPLALPPQAVPAALQSYMQGLGLLVPPHAALLPPPALPAAASSAGGAGLPAASGVLGPLQHFAPWLHHTHTQEQAAAAVAAAAAAGASVRPVGGLVGTGTGESNSAGSPASLLPLLATEGEEALDGAARHKRARIASQFDDLQKCYRLLRGGTGSRQQPAGPSGAATASAGAPAGSTSPAGGGSSGGGAIVDEGLHEFSRILGVLTRCSKLKILAEIPRHSLRGGSSSSNIISSLEFDRDGTRFATAGVSKRISIFEYAAAVQQRLSRRAPAPTPMLELVTRSKLSCLTWNKHTANHIASSDYEGVVAVWDVASSRVVAEYEAHSKRIWSLDYCTAPAGDPSLLASASDDCTVKLWSTRSPNSVAQIDMKANVCAVKWRPGSEYELTVGSADHCVYLYDTRATAAPLATCAGHRKAVSYVRYCNSDELVSASTDSTLRLWSLTSSSGGLEMQQQRVYEGHVNEKNFVGLAVEGDLLACGSETNEVFVYYKMLSKPVVHQSFAAPAPGGSGSSDEGDLDMHDGSGRAQQFISALSWRPGSQVLLVANSQGTIKLMQLTGAGGITDKAQQ